MRIIILTQNEPIYLPKSFARVYREFPREIAGIVSSPAMSPYGGPLRGLIRHLCLLLNRRRRFKSYYHLATTSRKIAWLCRTQPFQTLESLLRDFSPEVSPGE